MDEAHPSHRDTIQSIRRNDLRKLAHAMAAVLWLAAFASAQAPSATQPGEKEAPDDPVTVLPHSGDSRFYFGGQFNTVFQAHGDFHALYNGPNSLKNTAESEDSRVATLFLGARLTRYTAVVFHGESTAGRGISDALGLAGFTNLDVVRNPELGPRPYIARFFLDQVIPLDTKTEEAERSPLQMFTDLPERRLELRFGKLSTADWFDQNSIASDSHLQFLNWTVDNNGAYDYAADTRGYTWGLVAELHNLSWSFRFGEMLMPKVANGIKLEHDLTKAHSENFELELRPKPLANRQTTIRLLSFVNHADMGDYRLAVDEYLRGLTPVPDVAATRRIGRVKYGFGLNAEQEFGHDVRGFLRLGWNDDGVESFAYTEVGQTISLGGDVKGTHWRRKLDKAGVALTSSAISSAHQRYLRLGGLGFLLGDGNLRYGRETIFETYYTAHLWRGVFGSFDAQHINNPGYNRDRGPLWVPALRLHVDF